MAAITEKARAVASNSRQIHTATAFFGMASLGLFAWGFTAFTVWYFLPRFPLAWGTLLVGTAISVVRSAFVRVRLDPDGTLVVINKWRVVRFRPGATLVLDAVSVWWFGTIGSQSFYLHRISEPATGRRAKLLGCGLGGGADSANIQFRLDQLLEDYHNGAPA
jgi:hypothetical protein